MNYRLLLTEMLIDYKERRARATNVKKVETYTEIIGDLLLALDIEPNLIQNLNEAKEIINS